LTGKLIIGAGVGIGAEIGAGARLKGAEGAGLRGKVEVEPEGGAAIGGAGADICLEGAGGAGGGRSIGKAEVKVEEEGGGTAEAAEIGAGLRLI
jgi:hypothetical protein